MRIKKGSNAQFTGAGKGLTIIGEHCYAYSGGVTVSGTDDIALDFNTGKEVIVAKLQIQWLENGADGSDSYYNLEINGEPVAGNLIGTGHGEPRPTMNPENWIPIIIPPLSKVRVLFTMLSGGGSVVLGATLTGRVYG
jgi:hypothetical protein